MNPIKNQEHYRRTFTSFTGNLKLALIAWFRLIRPEHWVKNGFVLMPLVFSSGLSKPRVCLNAVSAFAAFCLAASGVYCVNDLCDASRDAHHPDKRNRPIASGLLSSNVARISAVAAWITALALGFVINIRLWSLIFAYILVNLAYSYRLKRIMLLDVFVLSLGYVLRVMAGATAIGVKATPWILVVTFFISLVLGFGKRRSEIATLRDDAANHRTALAEYSSEFLDTLVIVSVSSTVISYSIYAVEASSHSTTLSLVWTVPFVVFGLFRYLYILLASSQAGNPIKLLYTDRALKGSVLGWFIVVLLAIYL